MTQERFLKLMHNPDLLATVPYEELKTLALAYPYAHNLRYLLAIKAQQENHVDFSRNLATAATYSLSRAQLFSLVAPQKVVPQMTPAEEEQVLELKPIATVQKELDSKAPMVRTEDTSEKEAISKSKDLEDEEKKQNTSPSEPAQIPVLDFTAPLDKDALAEQAKPNVDTPEPTIPADIDDSSTDTGAGLSFGMWINKFNPPALVAESSDKEVVVGREDEVQGASGTFALSDEEDKEPTPQMLAEKSLKESKSIASETLAKLYAEQGFTAKAIDMYERLILAFPGKSAYFAAQIKKIKK